MEYLVKASAISIIFLLCYKLFLQRETFFQQNRWFLLTGLSASFFLPFLVFPIYIEQAPIVLENFTFTETQVTINHTEEIFNIFDYFPIIYVIGTVVFSIRFLFQLVSLTQIIIKNDVDHQRGYRFVRTNSKALPFSFFKWIVYNPSQFKTTELDHIITHEKVHVNQYHSIDSILVEISCIALWFNPFIWLYNKALKQNLEFLADDITQKTINCNKSYQYTLLKTSTASHQHALTNNFYNSLIKKRIVMLHKSKSKNINHLKYLLILPVLCWFLMSFNTKEIFIGEKQTKKTAIEATYKAIITKDKTDTDFKNIIEEAAGYGVTLKFKKIKKNSNNEIIKISAEFINGEKGSGTYNLDGIDPIKPFSYKQSKEGFGFFTEWETSLKIGKPFTDVKVIGYGEEKDSTRTTYRIKTNGFESQKKPLLIIDGKEVQNEILEKLDPDNIKSISVLKGENATKMYGDRGKNGVILITSTETENDTSKIKVIGYGNKTKNSAWKVESRKNKNIVFANKDTIYVNKKPNILINLAQSYNEEPLYILDGKEITKKELNAIDEFNIESISTYKKGSVPLKEFGDKEKNGVVIIETKGINSKSPIIKVIGSSSLYIVDGKEIKKEDFEKILPERIKKINVIKEESAIKKYGDKGKNGVIEVTTKK